MKTHPLHSIVAPALRRSLFNLLLGGAALCCWCTLPACTAHAQLASEKTLYTFSQETGFFGPLDYPPLFQPPGVSNSGIALYGLLPVTGQGDGGSGVFAYANGNVSTVYTDPNGSAVVDVFPGYRGSSGSASYAVSSQGLVSLPGGAVVNPTGYYPIIQASDGTFYGFGGFGLYRITSGGAAQVASVPQSVYIQLIQASDGNFYAISVQSFIRITPNGTVTTLYSFADSASEPAGIVEAPGSNASVFYGFRAYGTGDPNYTGAGIIFTFTTNPGGGSVNLTILHNLAADGSEGERPDSLVLATDGNLYGTALHGGANGAGTFFKVTPGGTFTLLYSFGGLRATGGGAGPGGAGPLSVAQLSDGNFYVLNESNVTSGEQTITEMQVHPAYFAGEASLGNGVYYLQFPDGTPFGYYSYLSDPHFIYHFDLGYEYVFDANDSTSGVFLYDFASNTFWYTSPSFPFPYLYDFTLNAVLYYYPDTKNAGRYTSNPRYFFNFGTGQIITK